VYVHMVARSERDIVGVDDRLLAHHTDRRFHGTLRPRGCGCSGSDSGLPRASATTSKTKAWPRGSRGAIREAVDTHRRLARDRHLPPVFSICPLKRDAEAELSGKMITGDCVDTASGSMVTPLSSPQSAAARPPDNGRDRCSDRNCRSAA
jgi:hypothetical protein